MGVWSDGFRTTQLPAARAAFTAPRLSENGKFHGDSTSTTPLGSYDAFEVAGASVIGVGSVCSATSAGKSARIAAMSPCIGATSTLTVSNVGRPRSAEAAATKASR